MKNDFNIISMSLNDVENIQQIQEDLKIHIISNDSLIKDLENINYHYFILKNNTEICGFIGFSKTIDTIDLLSIVIAKDFQSMGLSNLLMEHILDFAKLNNILNIFLEVRKSNVIAQNLYLKFKFKHINTRLNYYPDNLEDAYIYMRDL